MSAQPCLEAQLVASIATSGPYKRCGCCGRAYTRAQWHELELVARNADAFEVLEVRSCAGCKRTAAVVLEQRPANDDNGDQLDACVRAGRT